MDNQTIETLADAYVLDVRLHDAEICDSGAPCEMCRWADEQELLALEAMRDAN